MSVSVPVGLWPMKRYRDYNTYLKEIFGERVQKIAIDAGLGCPNRDGTISKTGCIFCDGRGSGTGKWIHQRMTIGEQVQQGRIFLARRYKAKKFIAYFQSFSNTYASVPTLKTLYDAALGFEDVVGLSVSTRPDCLNNEILALLAAYQTNHLVWLELGLQSAHDETLRRISRGHDAACFENAVLKAREYGLNICAHIILGLPGENRTMMLETADCLRRLPIQGLKIHLLYVIKGTPLAKLYQDGALHCLGRMEYAHLVVDFLERTPSDRVIQRLTGDPEPSELVAPPWALEKSKNLNLIKQILKSRNTWQGKRVGGRPPNRQTCSDF